MSTRILRPILTALLIVMLSVPALAGREIFLSSGQTVYVPVYSHIYQGIKGKPYNLSALLSIRNVDYNEPITITSVKYYDDNGTMQKAYFTSPVTIPPMGTKEVYIPERDTSGGSGANFTVMWESTTKVSTPIIQAVMIGTASSQGISFVCDGVAIKEKE
ncbi:DUF3124 domain-containing protein [Pseudodesulfovibrio sp. JC047]|uniref:DUF3124 domain-containing protein n=1 Tax=Pseudodesulfovibrio sp. JC047 TaxID=2683199 RepID=UPI0013D3FCF5|nr:DUF3124 domain-containing protein [Pseudodesulfovibrio sp. JC047]NDV19630.1 DUF3124 domain-containing protein [Pseudodesulfovibrio sp. JC047]